MKKLIYLFSLLLITGLSSCNQDDDDPAPQPIVGRWELDHIATSGFSNQQYNGILLDPYYLESFGSYIDIYNDNTFTRNDRQLYVGDISGTWTLANDQLTLKYDDGSDDDTFTYTKNKNVEILTGTTFDYSLDSTVNGKAQLIYKKFPF